MALTRQDLYSLEQYSDIRNDFRAKVMMHKKDRRVFLSDHCTLYFESKLTMQYQIQEMLRIEKIFTADGIQEELDAYNPLIPDGKNWKATFMIEYDDIDERKTELSRLIGVEDKVYVQVEGFDKVWAIADEDLERDTEEKTSSVHFMRFELSDEMVSALKQNAGLAMGIDHENCQKRIDEVPEATKLTLIEDLV